MGFLGGSCGMPFGIPVRFQIGFLLDSCRLFIGLTWDSIGLAMRGLYGFPMGFREDANGIPMHCV